MPGIDQKESSVGESSVSQPRQPTNLQGLLKFCIDATKAEDASSESDVLPMDEQRRKWLEEAIKSMSVDIINELQSAIEVLEKADQIKDKTDDIHEHKAAVEFILQHVENIDIACDFHKIGGFMILYPCLNCVHPKIRAYGCEILATLCQNNPYCQEVALDNKFIPKLLNMMEEDDDITVSVKALYAFSAIIRHDQEGFSQFIQYNGPIVLLKTLDKPDERFIKKATFLLTTLCNSQPDFKSRLVFLDYVPKLISLISGERQDSHEFVLSLLATIIEDNATAVTECKNPKYDLQQILQKYIEDCNGKEECLEELEYCKRILYLVFGYE